MHKLIHYYALSLIVFAFAASGFELVNDWQRGLEDGLSVQPQVNRGRLPMPRLIYATLVSSEGQIIRLARHIRDSAGPYSDGPIWGLIPERAIHLTESTRRELSLLRVSIHLFKPDVCIDKVPFALQVCAAATAEALAEQNADFLFWIDLKNLTHDQQVLFCSPFEDDRVLEPPRNISNGFPEKQGDDLARLIRGYGPPSEDRFKTVKDILTIRSYLESGSLIVRPGGGILRHWYEEIKRWEAGPPVQHDWNEPHEFDGFCESSTMK